jgi:hypothetical protein
MSPRDRTSTKKSFEVAVQQSSSDDAKIRDGAKSRNKAAAKPKEMRKSPSGGEEAGEKVVGGVAGERVAAGGGKVAAATTAKGADAPKAVDKQRSKPGISLGGLFGSRQRSFTHSSNGSSPRSDPDSTAGAATDTAAAAGAASDGGGVSGAKAAKGAQGGGAKADLDDALLAMLQKDEHMSVKVALQALKKAQPEWKKLKKGEVGTALVRVRSVMHAPGSWRAKGGGK